ncbi:tetratricopeptide repeat protein [Streptomyces acidiscabies]|uniref:Tetratricopeptide repeat protein n=1 Tax=Streptomyces acidiscabies TaxID=42234 RepID=A0ABU4MA25_9ACTN|nr:tetratricopeptide repeat protein [Streptomyces acidiscabies]MDX3024956.1 tetratricopeptide repeat protein [Streptomyces acidiscabies]
MRDTVLKDGGDTVTVNEIGGDARMAGVTVQTGTFSGEIHQHAAPAPAAPPPLPRQFPSLVRHFTDRLDDRAVLDRGHASGTRLFVISGLAGMGKTALAAQWLSRHGLPGGELYADLAGPDASCGPEAVLRRWLRALGIGRPPAELAELCGLWRSVTADRQVAVLIDGVSDVGQVRPLLPSTGCGVTVVTSRRALVDLAADGAALHCLKPLGPQDSLQLLAALTGEERIAAAPRDAARLADHCRGLPLPLVLAGARLASRPQHSVAAVTRSLLRRTRPGPPHAPTEDTAHMIISSALDDAYQGLTDTARLVYRTLALLPTGDTDAALTAAVCSLSVDEAAWELEVLDEEQLLEALPEAGGRVRYRLVPAARDHARRLALTAGTDEDHARMTEAACTSVLETATHAQVLLTPAQATLRLSQTDGPPAGSAPFDDEAGALAWLESHETSLLDLLHAAEAIGRDDLVWQLVDAFWPLFLRRHPYELWEAAHVIGLASARAAKHPAAVRQMLASGAIGLNAAGRVDDALVWYGQALAAAREAGDVRDEGQALLGLGSCHLAAGRPEQAEGLLSLAIGLWHSCGYDRGVALADIVRGEICLADEPDLALILFSRAHDDLLQENDLYDAARALLLHGHARAVTGSPGPGIQEMETALTTLTGAGSLAWRARALELLARAHHQSDDLPAARDRYEQAAQVYAEIRPADAARVRALAAGL